MGNKYGMAIRTSEGVSGMTATDEANSQLAVLFAGVATPLAAGYDSAQRIARPTVLVAFENDGQLVLVESWLNKEAHDVFIRRVLSDVAADMDFNLNVLTPVTIADATVIVCGAYECVAGV
ncbi:MAG TPA: hypothetical protein VLG36_02170 [Candidatus Chromulinivoraceae bacterium]|nr:hypothetical protein [Candidatus Chromulinivoraceae bacterium]